MIRQLAQCPYCNRCEVALDDHPEVVFNPDTPEQSPCPHLAWVDGRYSQWERTAHGANRVIGSTEFRWDHPALAAVESQDGLPDYLRELVNAGKGWPFAPAEDFAIALLSAEEKATDRKGKAYTVWDVDGWALYARDPAAFAAALPACQQKWQEGLNVEPGS
jgi:hypothetical protein